MLKAELHIHTKEDPIDRISYTAKELIDLAAQQGFQVLAFTCHDKVIHDPRLEDYAWQKNILLIPGIEKEIQGKHILLYNLTSEEAQKATSLSELRVLKEEKRRKNQPFLIIAAHPFHFGPTCLRNKVLTDLDLFDAWEYSFFYTKMLNPNKKTARLAKKYQKPLIGNSDVHHLDCLGKTCTLIRAKKDITSIFQAIKDQQTRIKTVPLPLVWFIITFIRAGLSSLKKIARKKQ